MFSLRQIVFRSPNRTWLCFAPGVSMLFVSAFCACITCAYFASSNRIHCDRLMAQRVHLPIDNVVHAVSVAADNVLDELIRVAAVVVIMVVDIGIDVADNSAIQYHRHSLVAKFDQLAKHLE